MPHIKLVCVVFVLFYDFCLDYAESYMPLSEASSVFSKRLAPPKRQKKQLTQSCFLLPENKLMYKCEVFGIHLSAPLRLKSSK